MDRYGNDIGNYGLLRAQPHRPADAGSRLTPRSGYCDFLIAPVRGVYARLE
ncbi:hypothetical protein FHX35_001054 [Auritidibacter ignavus]|nr:hypothetical protein [Auritidibacter ignavus]